MKLAYLHLTDDDLHQFCRQAALICTSKKFKLLHKEMSKKYRQSGVPNSKIIAFQDSLFTLYLEEYTGQDYTEPQEH